MYAARRSGLKKEMFGYVSGGYRRVLQRYEQQLTADGVEICTGTRLEQATRETDGIRLQFSGGVTETCDRVILTVPSPLISAACPQLSPQEHAQHNGIRYQGIVCASLVLKRSLSPYYVTNITDDWVPFTAVIGPVYSLQPS